MSCCRPRCLPTVLGVSRARPYMACAAFMESVRIRGSYGLGLGEGTKRRFAIPQGCPLSLTFLCLLTRIWVLFIQATCPYTSVRVVADDLMLVSEFPAGFSEEEAVVAHLQAMDSTVAFLRDMGRRWPSINASRLHLARAREPCSEVLLSRVLMC